MEPCRQSAALAVTFLFSACVGCLAWSTSPKTPIKNKSISQSLRLTARLDQAKVRTGEAVTLRLTLTNTERKAFSLIQEGPQYDYILVIKDPARKVARIERVSPEISWITQFRDLAPGQSLSDQYALNEVYQFNQEGRYIITATRKIPFARGSATAYVSSNPVTLFVKGISGDNPNRH